MTTTTTTTTNAEQHVMIPKNRIPTHPGVILLEEFLTPMEISQTKLAEHLNIPVQRINELIKGKRGVTTETAWLLAGAFKTTPNFWMNLQTQHDLAKSRPERRVQVIR
jgi:antitoxin HigA-1